MPTVGQGVPPPAPSDLRASELPTEVLLRWEVATEAQSYNVFRAGLDGNWVQIATGLAATSLRDENALQLPVQYRVVGVNGAESSAPSEVLVSPNAAALSLTSVLLQQVSQTSFTLNWSLRSAGDALVEIGIPEGPLVPVYSNDNQATSHSTVLQNLQPNTAYWYRITSTAPGTVGVTYLHNLYTGTPEITAPVNHLPISADQWIVVQEDSSATFALVASDMELDPVEFSLHTAPSNGTVQLLNGGLVYTPNPNYFGVDHLTYAARDGEDWGNTATIKFSIVPTPDAPVASVQTVEVPANRATEITLGAQDPDGDALQYTITTAPGFGGVEVLSPGIIRYSPSANFVGTDSLGYTVNDGNFSAAGTVHIVVSDPNKAPVAQSQIVLTDFRAPVPIVLSATDVNGNPLSYSIISGPNGGTLSGLAPNLVYTPGTTFSGSDVITFVANDGVLTSAPATVEIIVGPGNLPPRAPSALSAAALPKMYVQLSWNDNSYVETGYRIERSADGLRWKEIARVGVNVKAFKDHTTGKQQQWLYRVRAVNEYGFSTYSGVARVITRK